MNKKLISTAVGASLALTAGLAQATHETPDYILFPYVVKDTNRTTIITIIGSDGGVGTSSNQAIHLQYWTKSTTDANTAACQPSSVFFSYTDNDIVSIDTAGLLSSGALFGDTTNAAPLGTSISYAGPRHAIVAVHEPGVGSTGR